MIHHSRVCSAQASLTEIGHTYIVEVIAPPDLFVWRRYVWGIGAYILNCRDHDFVVACAKARSTAATKWRRLRQLLSIRRLSSSLPVHELHTSHCERSSSIAAMMLSIHSTVVNMVKSTGRKSPKTESRPIEHGGDTSNCIWLNSEKRVLEFLATRENNGNGQQATEWSWISHALRTTIASPYLEGCFPTGSSWVCSSFMLMREPVESNKLSAIMGRSRSGIEHSRKHNKGNFSVNKTCCFG